ncbi:amidase [Poseidonibacter lekithochrous]|uniref:amidase n=1 Tax=Poseidonibacter lekithochrous TaxID=1904463 RepID=UPI000D356A6F|nr:amidase [Poseidonibacter lekithochrous]
MEFHKKSLVELISGIENKTFTIKEIISDIINRSKEVDKKLNVFEDVDYDYILEKADELDQSEFPYSTNFKGIPIGVKDCYNTERMYTRRGSSIYKDYTAGNDARIIRKARDEGALVIGKTKMAEFSIHEPSDTLNPYNLDHTPGTSSSGSAVAVATGIVPLSFGTQTAASTSKPASYCGIYGFKPTFGVFPRTGVLKTSDTLDTLSVFTRTIEDIEYSFDNLRLSGQNHPYIYNNLDDKKTKNFDEKTKIALIASDSFSKKEEYAKEAFSKFKDELSNVNNFEVEFIELPSFLKDAREVHRKIYNKSISYYFKSEYINHQNELSSLIIDIIEDGDKITLEEYLVELDKQQEMSKEFNAWIKNNYDVVLTLSSSSEAPKGLDYNNHPDSTLIWTLLGLPILATPKFKGPNNLPFGFQIVSAKYDDYNVIEFAKKLKKEKIISDSQVVEL